MMTLQVSGLLSIAILISGTVAQFEHNGPALYQISGPMKHQEGPVWDDWTQRLYFLDFNKLYSYVPLTNKFAFIEFDVLVSPVVLVKGATDKFIIGLNRSIYELNWDGKSKIHSLTLLTTVSNNFPFSRLNDGKADSWGRLLIGTMGKESSTGVAANESALYQITKNNLQNPLELISPVSISNGLAWNKAGNKFYYVDSWAYNIMEYTYNQATGEISNARKVIDIGEAFGGLPSADGMTIDKDDNLWVALVRGGSVAQINPTTGNVMRRIAIPSDYVTSVGWGGPLLNTLYVTTSNMYLTPQQKLMQPAAGSLFAVTGLGTSGLPVNRANILP